MFWSHNMTDPRLSINNLCVDYPGSRVVNNISFTLGNERLALVGESGSGKSMTARALMGLVRKPGVVTAGTLNIWVVMRSPLTRVDGNNCAVTISQWYCKIRVMHLIL